MEGEPWKKHVGILAYDLKGYGKMAAHERRAAQGRLAGYAAACTPDGAAQIGWRPTGDGGFIFFDGPLGTSFDAVGLFRAAMTEAGQDPLPTVRFALHDGHVSFNGSDYDGTGLILVSRLLDGMPRQPAGLTVLSDDLARALLDDRAGYDRHLVRLQDVDAKEGPLPMWAATESTEFRDADQAKSFNGSLGPRPWGFQQEDWNFDEDEIAAFLERQPKHVPAGFAARAALRVSVTVISASGSDRPDLDAIISPTLYATAPPLFAGTWPNRGGDAAAFAARAAAFAAAFAARAAANAAAGTAADAAVAAADAAVAAANAAGTAAVAAVAARTAADAALAAMRADLRSLLGADGDAARISGLMTSPLWPADEPDWFRSGWANLKKVLLDHDPSWSVWVDWYEERLRGAPANMERELARATALTAEDYKKGAVHMNHTVQAALERFEQGRSPTPGTVEVSPREQKVVRTEAPSVETPAMPGVSDAEFFQNLCDQIAPMGRRVLDPNGRNDVAMFRPAFEEIWEILQQTDSPGNWLNGIEELHDEVRHLKRVGEMDRTPAAVSMLLKTLDEHDLMIRDRFPEEAAVNNARRSQNQEPLPEATPEALEEVLDAATGALSDELQAMLGDLLKDAPTAKAEPSPDIEQQPLTIKQRDTLYRLKALFLAVKANVEKPRQVLETILGRAAGAAEAIERFERVAVKFAQVWDRIASFLTSG